MTKKWSQNHLDAQSIDTDCPTDEEHVAEGYVEKYLHKDTLQPDRHETEI